MSNVSRESPNPPDVDEARYLLEMARVRNDTKSMLAAAQVHATLAVEQAVRDLIATTEGHTHGDQ